jgi:hypothetical protein
MELIDTSKERDQGMTALAKLASKGIYIRMHMHVFIILCVYVFIFKFVYAYIYYH